MKFINRTCFKIVASLMVMLMATSASAQTPKLYHGEYPGNRTFNSNLDASNLQTLSALGDGKLDIEVDKDQGYLYWTGFTSNGIYRSRLDGSGAMLLHGTAGSPFGIAIDSSGERVFVGHWSSRDLDCGNLDGSGALVTLLTAPANITDVEYNSASGFLYYGVINSGIWRVAIGAGCTISAAATQVVIDNTGRPYGLALDPAGNRMWWTNSTQDRISTANLNGGGLNLNFCNTGNWLAGIDYFDGNLYYSDYGADNSYVNPDNACAPVALGNTAPNRPWGIAVVEFNPEVSIEKSTNGSDSDTAPGDSILVGDSVVWEYVVGNVGDTVFIDPEVSDSDLGLVTTLISGDTDSDGELDPGESWTMQATGTAVAGQYMNTGTFSGETDLSTVETLTDPETDDSHYFGNTGPTLVSFTSSTADGTYGPSSVINITANYSEALAAGSVISVTLNNGVSLTLNVVAGSSLSGTYTVGATGSSEDILDLTVSSLSAENVVSLATAGVQSSSTLPAAPNNLGDSSEIDIDVTAPILMELTPVPTPGNNPNPSYSYSSDEAGSANFTGACDSVNTAALASNNTIVLDSDGAGAALADGTYAACQITVTDAAGNTSLALGVSSFTIDTQAPQLLSFSSSSADNKYGPGFSINITATYDSALGAGSSLVVVLGNGVSVSLSNISGASLSGVYTVGATGSGEDSSDLTVGSISSEAVEDLLGNLQNASTVPGGANNLGGSSNIVVDTTAPVLAEITPVFTPSGDPNPSWTYSSSEAGAATFSGGCNSSSLVVVGGNNSLNLDSDGAGGALAPGTYGACQVVVADVCGNSSIALPISNFVIESISPGGVSAGLELWFKADLDVWSDNGTSVATNGQNIQRWSDQSGNDYDALQDVVGDRPNILINTATGNNFNPTLVFNGSSDRMPILDKFYDSNSSLDQVGIYAVYRTTLGGSWAFIDYDRSEWYNTNVAGNDMQFNYRGLTAIRDNSVNVGSPRDGLPHITGFIFDNSLVDETIMRFDGAEVYAADREPAGVALEDSTRRYGYIGDGSEATNFNSAANNVFYEGDISEIIVYDNLSFTASDKRQIETYLAIKYGITLDGSQDFYQDSTGGNVFNLDDGANGGAVGDQIADWQDVAGLARDSISSLDQRISKSVNVGSEMTVATDNDFTSPNLGSRTAVTDGSYLLWGHDGASISSTQTSDINLVMYSARIGREWKFENTSFGQSVNIQIANLPALAPGKAYQLITDADGDFSAGSSLLATSTNGVFTTVTIPPGINYLTVAFLYDDVDMEFAVATAGDLESVGGNIPLLLLDGNITAGLSVDVSITSVDALAGADYTIVSTVVPPGVYDGTLTTAVPIALGIVNDGTAELDEILNITLDPPINPAVQIADVDGDTSIQGSHQYTIEDDDFGPGGVADRVLFWIRADRDTSTTADGIGIQLWGDQLVPQVDAVQNNGGLQPTYQDEIVDEWNFNPVVLFDGANDRMDLPDTAFINLASTPFKVLHMAFTTGADVNTRQLIYEEGAGVRGFSGYLENGSLSFGAWNFANDGVGAPWGYADCDFSGIQPNTEYIATMHLKGNNGITGSIECFVNGEQSGSPGTGVGILYPHPGDVGIGAINQTAIFDNGTYNGQSQGSGAAFAGDIAEVVYYDDFDQDSISQNKVESYLAIKYGLTLHQGAGGQNYQNSVGQTIYDAVGTHSTFNHDIAGISMDSGSDFQQPKSKSVNSDAIFTIGNASGHDDHEALLWGNDDAGLASWSSAGLPGGYERILRTWRFDEQGDVGTVEIEIDSSSLPALDKDDYVLMVDADGDFSAGAAVYPLTVGAGVLSATAVEPAGDSWFTIAQRDITPPVISLVTAVPTPGIDRTPPFTFSSTEAGSITMAGSCGTITTAASTGNNTITLDSNSAGGQLADGVYSNCTISVTDDCGNVSNVLSIPAFEIYATLPNVQISVNNATISETGGIAIFTLTLSNQYAAATTVTLSLSGTAASSDYSSGSLTVVIPALSTSGTFVVNASDDAIDEFNETVIVDIQSVTGGNELGVQQAQTTIIDDDAEPSVTLSIDQASIPEMGGLAVITATLSAPSEKPITVNLDFSNSTATLGPDFSISGAVITIPALSGTGTVNVTAVDDTDDDDGEFVIADIDTVLNGTESGMQQVSTEIIDDDIACNVDPWQPPVPLIGTMVISAHGEFTDTASYLPPSGADFDSIIMGRSAADATIRRNQAFNYFLTTFGVDWSAAVQIDPATWITASGDLMLIHAMTDPRYDYRLNSASDRRLHAQNGEVYEGVYLMIVMSPSGTVLYGSYGGAGGEWVDMGGAAISGEIFSTVPVLCNDGSIDPETFYMLYQSLEPTQNNVNDKVLHNDEIVNNDRFGSSVAFALSRKGLYLEPGTLDYEAQVVNIGQFYP